MPATPNRTFRRAAARKKVERPTTRFGIERLDAEGEVVSTDYFHATMPTDEAMFIIAARIGDDENDAAAATALLDLLRESMPAQEFRTFRKRLLDPQDEDLTMGVMEEIVEMLMEEWSTFPTAPSSDSSTSPTPTGTTSTGRVRGSGSTSSNSRSTGS